MKIAIIVPYFGKLPNYFQLFLDSCKCNKDYEWLIFTNDQFEYDYPKNVHRFIMQFVECRELVQSKFQFDIILQNPQKLCDYKCAYGLIFSDYLQNFDWWGHCDLDQIFGCLHNFITEDMLNSYDKLFSLGHLTLYRNTPENNVVFKGKLNGRSRYKEVFTTERGCGFDEWLPDNVNDLYLQSGRPVNLNNLGADINSYKTVFSLVNYDIENHSYHQDMVDNSIFKWKNGHIYQLYYLEGKICKREFPYVHLQKRKMKDLRKQLVDSYYIIPNRFVDGNLSPQNLLKSSVKWKVFNFQYFRVKWKSFKYRISNEDWNFQNVFNR